MSTRRIAALAATLIAVLTVAASAAAAPPDAPTACRVDRPDFQPGAARTYTASTTATVTSTAGDATLAVSDPGHLANGAFTLPQSLQVGFSKTTWTAPASNDVVNVGFTQRIEATDALRTGAYSKTLTFTLSTTSP